MLERFMMFKVDILTLNRIIQDYKRTKALVTNIIAEEYEPVLHKMAEQSEAAAPRRFGFLAQSFGLKQKTYRKSVLFSIVGVTTEKFTTPKGKTAQPSKYFHLVTRPVTHRVSKKKTKGNSFFDEIQTRIMSEVQQAEQRAIERIENILPK
ncbi:MAG: hypothetical protein ACRC2T_12370 [Thermoguttaceae bacterium]